MWFSNPSPSQKSDEFSNQNNNDASTRGISTAAEYKTTTECDNHGASMAADFKTRKPTTSSTARAFMVSGKVII